MAALTDQLKTRNSCLRHGIMDKSVVAAWDRELCIAGDEINQLRRSYITKLKPVFESTLAKLLELPDLKL